MNSKLQMELQRKYGEALARFRKNPRTPRIEINPFTGKADIVGHPSMPPPGLSRGDS